MKYYNKETRNSEGVYYRNEDWGVEDVHGKLENKPNFTTAIPPAKAMREINPIPVDYDEDTDSFIFELSSLKIDRIKEIDKKTNELLLNGFTYNGNNFSMSNAAQRNWAALGAAKANGMLMYPITISTVNEGSYEISDDSDCIAFLAAYMTYQTDPSSPLGSGRILKLQINAAQSVAEVEEIIDNR